MEIYGMSGEKLGTIGEQTQESSHTALPEWKKAFLSTPSISTRRGIASNYDTPYEDTSTLVLTVPSGKFVDIRLPLPSTLKTGEQNQSVTSHSSFWAFSGTVTTTFLEPATNGNARADSLSIPYAAHAVFKHDLDSKGSGIVDEGDMFLLPNGDTMEVGVWTNPSTGKYEMYKEYWTSPSPATTTAALGHNVNSSSELTKTPYIVVETQTGSHGQGVVIRIGDYIQGLFREHTEGSELLFGRFERREVSGPFAERGPSFVWFASPDNTADDKVFPLNGIYDADSKGEKGDVIHTDIGGSWIITELGR